MEKKRSQILLLILLTLTLVVCVVPQGFRLVSVVRFSDMQVDTGIEGPNFYSIWRVRT